MKLTSRLTTCLLAGCIGFAVLPASHANNENRDYLTADDTLRMYEYEIESETIKRVNKSIDTAELAKEIGLRPPVMPPNLSQEQVRAQVEQEITDAVEQKYPSSYFNQIKLDAVAKHRLYSLDEEITITVRNRNGLWVPMTGALRKVDDGGIRLGDQWFNKEDIRSSDHVHFYREEHTLAREAYSRTQTGQYAAKREDYTTKMRRALEFKIWRRYGYVYLRARNQYYPESEYYLFRLEKARTDRYEEMRSAVEMSVMKREGWRWNVDTNTWMNTRIVNTPAATPAE